MPGPGRYSPANLIRSQDLPKKRTGKPVRLQKKLDDPEEMERWEQQLADPSKLKVIDLFCGAGGMSEGFINDKDFVNNEGFVIVVAFDRDPEACNTFAANIPSKILCADIAEISDPQKLLEGLPVSSVDVIVGGPPCQGFSQVGRARILSLKEHEQVHLLARNELYLQFFRFVEAFQPAFFIMENVPTLLSFADEAYIHGIKRECERLGYDSIYSVLDAADYGVPQVRRRLFIVGSKTRDLFRWPRKTHVQNEVTLHEAIGDLPEVLPLSEEERLLYQAKLPQLNYQRLMRSQVPPSDREYIYDHVVRPAREDDIYIFTHMKPGDRYIDIDPRYQRYNPATFKDKYYKLKPDSPGVTVTAHLAKDGYRYIHWDNNQHRTISVREAARIQSFGDHFRFSGSRSSRYRQIGNAVPPLMAQALAEQVRLAIRRNRGALPGEFIQLGLPGYEYRSQLLGEPT